MSRKTVELEVEVRATTAMAVFVYTEKGSAWVPKSQIEDYAGSEELDADVTSIFVPEWLAVEKGLV